MTKAVGNNIADQCGSGSNAVWKTDGEAPMCDTGGCSFYDNSALIINPGPTTGSDFTILIWVFQYFVSS